MISGVSYFFLYYTVLIACSTILSVHSSKNGVETPVRLLSFDSADQSTYSRRWILTDDPVMGGLSNSTWTEQQDQLQGTWEGTVRIVPSLKAPGFCNLMSARQEWNDANGFTHLIIRAKSTINYKGFKVSFGADTLNLQFKCFKADFEMESTGEWEEIYVPFKEFSNDWSSYTGEPITKCSDDVSVCPTDKNLKDIEQIGFWMEGVAGDFHFELKEVLAGYAPVK